ncbi:unnamed protein product [Boreogadus saida]
MWLRGGRGEGNEFGRDRDTDSPGSSQRAQSTETPGRGGGGVRSVMNMKPCPQRHVATSTAGLHPFKVLHVLMDETIPYKDKALHPGVLNCLKRILCGGGASGNGWECWGERLERTGKGPHTVKETREGYVLSHQRLFSQLAPHIKCAQAALE